MPDLEGNQLWQGMKANADRALANPEAGVDPEDDDNYTADWNAYIEKLESKVREQAMTLWLVERAPIEARRVST
jgi:hypothetical protein